MSYLAITLNHLRAVRNWAVAHDARLNLDMLAMTLEVRARNRYYTLHPRFLARTGERLAHTSVLTDDVFGFIGWLPYQTLRWGMATDKLAFRQHLLDHQLKVPAAWSDPSQATAPHLLKRSVGSFGYAQRGPYHAGQTGQAPPGEAGTLFAEQFIAGTNLKIWVWGETPFFAHVDTYPMLTGDGQASVSQLLTERLAEVNLALNQYPERSAIDDSLRHQGIEHDHVLPAGQQAWIDYRYGRLYVQSPPSAQSDNRLSLLNDAHHAQIGQLIAALTPALQREFPAPVLYAIDGVIDADNQIWWLEMNSNPILPPEGYAHIFSTLFGTPVTP